MRAFLILLLGLLLASMLPMSATFADDTASAAAASVLVQTTMLRQGSLPRTITGYGSVQADPSARNTVMAPLAANVGAIYVRVGQQVPQGAPLLQLVPNPQTSALYAQAVSAQLAAAESLKRTQALLAEQLATHQQVADAHKALADALAALAALRAQGASGPTTLRAPYHAIVTAVSVSVHAIVMEGAPLVDLARPNGLVLLVGIVPDQAATVMRGDEADITPLGGSRSYAGKVTLRGSVVDMTNGLVPIQISVPPGALLPGQSAATSITTGSVQGYVVPHGAILVDDNGDPYVVQAVQMIAKIVHVHVVYAGGDQDVIDGPLDRAAPLILAGSYQLQDGMKVRLQSAIGHGATDPSAAKARH
ncbi:MAG TPA: efflux RND transporter periplasmic adaptor subunit [Steroidobacteraceae bacterium]|jgi:RND family efflux transporter MFP subunit